MRPLETDTSLTRRLTARYIFALTSVAVLSIAGQCLIQFSLWRQSYDSRTINVAGRQRMLSQELVKAALATSTAATAHDRQQRLDEMKRVLDVWSRSHQELLGGNSKSGLVGRNSLTILSMFDGISAPFERMRNAAGFLVNGGLDGRGQALQLQTLLDNEQQFLEAMDVIVYQYDKEAHARVVGLRAIELVLLAITLTVLILEGALVFRPAADRIRRAFDAARNAQEREAGVAREWATIFNAAPALIWYQDPDGFLLRANRGAIDAFGLHGRNLRAICIYDLLGPAGEFLRRHDRLVLSGAEGVERRIQTEIDAPNAKRLCLKFDKEPLLDQARRPIAMIVLAEDITGHELLERRLLHLRSEEQRRIGQDLHDGLGQLLTGVLYLSKRLGNALRQSAPEQAGQATEINELVKDAIANVRALSKGLCPIEFGPDRLLTALEELAETTERVSGIECRFMPECDEVEIDVDIAEHLFRIVQEAISNALRHSQASRIDVTVSTHGGGLEVRVSDDGIGALPAPEGRSGGMGLKIMQRRAQLCGAVLTLDNDHGTTIVCTVPHRESMAQGATER